MIKSPKLKEKVLVMLMMDKAGTDMLEEGVEEVVVVPNLDRAALFKAAVDATAIYVGYPNTDRPSIRNATGDMIEKGGKLKVLAVTGTAFDTIDEEAAAARQLPILYCPLGGHTLAEHAITLMLSAARGIQQWGQALREWKVDYVQRLFTPGEELEGKTVGVIGLGNIGQYFAQKCKLAFNMRVIVYDPYVDPQVVQFLGVERVDTLPELLQTSDFVALHVAHTQETRHLIGRKELGQMKSSAYLINTSRGIIIDESALIDALQDGTITGAALDVFDPDPPDNPNNPLFKLPNVTVTPHMGGLTKERERFLAVNIAEQILKFLGGQTPDWVRWT